MIDRPNPLKMMVPIAVLVMFILAEGLCRRGFSDEYEDEEISLKGYWPRYGLNDEDKTILLKDEEDVIVSASGHVNLKVKCDYPRDSRTNHFEWKKIKTNKWTDEVPPNEILTTSKWMKFENPNYGHRGKYSCSINGTQGNRTFTEKRGFILKLPSGSFGFNSSAPIFNKDNPKEIPFLINSTLRLNCPFFTSSDAEYAWYRHDKLLVKRKTYVLGMYYANIDNEYYSSTRLKLSDSGVYTCVVGNSLGTNQHSFFVVVYADVNKMPLSFEYPRDLSLKSGELAVFYNQAFDYGANELQWYFLNSTNPTDIDIETVDLSQFKKMENGTNVKIFNNKLLIDNVTIDDAGWYICVLYGYNKMFMAQAKLDVQSKTLTEVTSEYLNQDKRMSDDEHFLLSLLPTLSALPMDKKLMVRIAFETSLLNIAFQNRNTVDKCQAATEENNTTQKQSTLYDTINQTTEKVD